jgi:predicted dehydrogenase
MERPRPTSPVRIGIVGCGNVMDGAYMPAIDKLCRSGEPVEVVAACHTSAAKCKAVLAKWRIPHFTTDYRELVTSPQVDLVLVLTSMAEHGAITKAALEAGKHVLVEKPMATTLEEAAQLVDLARKSRGYLVAAPFVILSPTYRTIWKRVRRGDIGRVLNARARYGWAGPDWGEWFYRPGGGCLFDLAVYNIASLTGLLGPARRVMAMTGTAILERRVNGKPLRAEAEDNAHVLIDFGDSILAVVTTGFTLQKYRSPALELYGSEGTLQMLGDDWAPNGYELWQNEVGAWQFYEETDPFWSWTDGLRYVVECIQTRVCPIITPEHAFHVLEITIAAKLSGLDGETKEIRSTFEPPAFAEEVEEHLLSHRIHDRRRE